MRKKIGNYVIGNKNADESYSITTSKALMVVRNVNNRNNGFITVEVLRHKDVGRMFSIGSRYSVLCNAFDVVDEKAVNKYPLVEYMKNVGFIGNWEMTIIKLGKKYYVKIGCEIYTVSDLRKIRENLLKTKINGKKYFEVRKHSVSTGAGDKVFKILEKNEINID